MKKILTYLLALTLCLGLPLALTSCKCDTHTDADWNYVCDVCEEALDPIHVDYTLTILDQDDLPVEGVTLTLTQGDTTVATLTTNASGVASGNVVAGAYTLTVDDYPIGYYPANETIPLLITPDVSAFTIEFENTIPNGTAARPYPVIEDENTATIASGQTMYYHAFGVERIVKIENAPATLAIVVEDTSYTPDESGTIEVLLLAKDGDARQGLSFAIANTGAEEVTVTYVMQSPEGSMENPYAVTLGDTTAQLRAGGVVFYLLIAEADGYIAFTTENGTSIAQLYNLTSYEVQEDRDGATFLSVAVTAGDEVRLELSSSLGAETTIDFTLSFSETNPAEE